MKISNFIDKFIILFRRSTNSVSFIPEIDGLRFFAIITVVIFHLNTAYSRYLGLDDLGVNALGGKSYFWNLGWWLIRLDLGVKVFFAISGFVLALPFIKHYMFSDKLISLKDYYIRRLTRLEPPFIITLILFYLVHIFYLGQSYDSLIPHFISGIIYSHVFIYGVPSPINPPTWSLETEAQFYLLFPLILWFIFFCKNKFYKIFAIILLFSLSIYFRYISVKHNLSHISTSIFAFLSNFLTGFVFAFLYIKNPNYFILKSKIWDFFGGLFVFGLFYFYKPQTYWLNNINFNICTFGLFFSVFKGYYLNWFFTRPVIFIIGGMCYTIYLLHYAFLHLWIKYVGNISINKGYGYDLILQILLGFPAILGISAIFYLIVEKPCMNKNWPFLLKNRILSFINR